MRSHKKVAFSFMTMFYDMKKTISGDWKEN